MKKKISIILAPFSIGGPNDAAKDGPKALMSNDLNGDLEELGFSVKIIKPPSKLLRLKKVTVSKTQSSILNPCKLKT